jgi:hypothetical protein
MIQYDDITVARLEAHHPLLGRPTPTVEELVARASSAARQVIEAATALARWRVGLLGEVEAIRAELVAEPWPEAVKAAPVEPSLACGDVLRALLALRPDDLTPLLAGGSAPQVLDMSERWRRIVQGVPASPARLPLDPRWGRRWALAEARGLASIDVIHLAASLDDPALDALATLGRTYAAGESTLGEAVNWAWDAIGRAGAARFEAVPPAYLDRHDGLVRLDEALRAAPGAVLVGPPGSGRKALVRAWDERTRTAGAGGPLPGYRVRIDPFVAIWEGNEADCESFATNRVVLVITAPTGNTLARRVAERFSAWP